MQPYQQRVVTEKIELDGKRAKLAAFIGTEAWEQLSDADQTALRCQLHVMNLYSEILGVRISAFSKHP